MRNARRIALGLLILLILLTAGLWLRAFLQPETSVKSVPRGDQEIAWIDSATNGANWERLVAAIHHLQQTRSTWPNMVLEDTSAFPTRSYDVPEIGIRFAGCQGCLWLRWYKVTSEMTIGRWVEELARRSTPPLALIGGSSSSDALSLADHLGNAKDDWPGTPPLLFITNATADKVWEKGSEGPDLMKLYPERTFRFCFRNSQMAEAVLDFVWQQPDLKPTGTPPTLFRLEWLDNPYSLDLSYQFLDVLEKKHKPYSLQAIKVQYSVGDFHRPNPPEAVAVENLIAGIKSANQRPLLILPVGSQPARRLLRAITASAPETRQIVAVTGDSIGFNTVYRDRAFAWHIQDVPVPLVFFAHHSPIEQKTLAAKSTEGDDNTSTDTLLLFVSILEKTLRAAFPWREPQPSLVASADQLRTSLREQQHDFFDTDGNRRSNTGEFVGCLRPRIEENQVQSAATLEIWKKHHTPDNPMAADRWQRCETLQVDYAETLTRTRLHGRDEP